MFDAPFYIARRPLTRFVQALEKGEVRIGFLGGSITDPRSNDRWSDMVCYSLCSRYPRVRFRIVNAAIGATDSLHAVMRADQDMIPFDCDLVFVEYAVNDLGLPAELRRRSREGLVRKLRKTGCDLVFTYTYEHSMQADMMARRLPDSIAGLEEIAAHYQIPSVFMSSYALDCVRRGLLRWEEWLPDGLHPTNCGSRFYAQPVLALLDQEMTRRETAAASPIPQPLQPNNLESCYQLPFEKICREGCWLDRQALALPLIHHTLSSFSPDARLAFDFEGTGLVLCVDFGTGAADFMYRLDHGEWKTHNWDHPAWFPPARGWVRSLPLIDDLTPGPHHMEIALCPPGQADYKGCNMDICYIGIMP